MMAPRTGAISPLDPLGLLTDAVTRSLDAAADLAAARGGHRPEVTLDPDAGVVAAASERHLRRDGEPLGPPFDPLSTFMECADGWIRTHANYPWHREALLQEMPDGNFLQVAALDAEAAVVARGGCAAAVRPVGEWTTDVPLVATETGPQARRGLPAPAAGGVAASGVKVIDLTKVIAGPVGTRMVAALGADVTRVADPARPELELAVLDGGLGKRSLRADPAREPLDPLIPDADVLLLGYRPGALDRFGLHPDALAERFPDLVVVQLSAWGGAGPSGALRGFDSLVQAATGISVTVREEPPGALPVQALDHATGYLIAAAALEALAARERDGHAGRARLALAATARELLARGPGAPWPEVDPAPHLTTVGELTVARPPGALDGVRLAWPPTWM